MKESRVMRSRWKVVCLLHLSIITVVGKTNIALNKAATQSSTKDRKHASLAVDGNRNSNYSYGSCTHTQFNVPGDKWWEVDLGANYDISGIQIFNRVDCCGERLNSFFIEGGLECGSSSFCYTQCYNQSEHPHRFLDLSCSKFTARFIKITVYNENIFSLCEVEVYGEASSTHLGPPVCYISVDTDTSAVSTSTETFSSAIISTFLESASTSYLTTSWDSPDTSSTSYGMSSKSSSLSIDLYNTESPATSTESNFINHFGYTTDGALPMSNDCICVCHPIFYKDAKIIQDSIQDIKDNLTVDSATLSYFRRKKTSAKDERPSATSVGYTGIAFLLIVVGAFLLPDLVNVLYFFLSHRVSLRKILIMSIGKLKAH